VTTTVTLHDALRRLAETSKISQHARNDVLDLIEDSDQAQIDANIEQLENVIDEVRKENEDLRNKIERIEAEVGLRNSENNDDQNE